MTYNDACKIGSNIEGYVKCTYAKIYGNGVLFSLNHNDCLRRGAQEQLTQALGAQDDGDVIAFVEDIPVVKAVGIGKPMPNGKETIEVQLTPYCKDVIYRLLKRKRANSKQMDLVYNNDATYLVKECAIDWFPTNISNVLVTDPNTGKQVSIDVAIDDAKKRLDRAKAILAGATALAFI